MGKKWKKEGGGSGIRTSSPFNPHRDLLEAGSITSTIPSKKKFIRFWGRLERGLAGDSNKRSSSY